MMSDKIIICEKCMKEMIAKKDVIESPTCIKCGKDITGNLIKQ